MALCVVFEFLLVWKVKVTQLCPTLCDPMDCSLPGSSVHGILQARILEWLAIPFSRGSSWPRDRTQVSHIVGRFFTVWTTREALLLVLLFLFTLFLSFSNSDLFYSCLCILYNVLFSWFWNCRFHFDVSSCVFLVCRYVILLFIVSFSHNNFVWDLTLIFFY